MRRKLALLATVAAAVAFTMGAAPDCDGQKNTANTGGKASKKKTPKLPVTINEDDGDHELSGFGKWKYGKELKPSARFIGVCKWKLLRLQNRTWVVVESGGAQTTIYVERDPKNRPMKINSKSCGRWS